MELPRISPSEFEKRRSESGHTILLDVREINEFAEVAAAGALNYPLSSLSVSQILEALKLSLSDQHETLYFICRSGARSAEAARAFLQAGYTNVCNVEGGTMKWKADGLPLRQS